MIKLGSVDVPFVFRGSELVYPDYVRDGLVLHYDFSAMSNSFDNRGIAKDLSGNGNDGTLNNFNYTDESGYDGRGLKFDGVDDRTISDVLDIEVYAMESVFLDGEVVIRTSSFTSLKYNAPSSGLALSVNGSKTRFVCEYGIGDAGGYASQYFSKEDITSDILSKKEPIHAILQINPTKNEATLYINGKHLETVALEHQYSPAVTEVVAGNIANNISWGSFSDSKLFSGRVYNRPLSTEEIAHNYAIEKERFNL